MAPKTSSLTHGCENVHMLLQDMHVLEGLTCEHWVQDDGVSRMHIYIDSATQGENDTSHGFVHMRTTQEGNTGYT